MERYQRVLEGAAIWGSFYRSNPEKFVGDYLHVQLRRFQKILLSMMFWSSIFVFIACRGIGKTFLSAIYCVTRCILYPGTRVCVVSGTRGQAINVLEKITQELKPRSAELAAEINEKESQINGSKAEIVFHNGSVIKVVTAKDSARGNRCNVLLIDESRLVSKETINTILRKFLTQRRMPDYRELTAEQRKREYDKEKNLTLYLTSAYFKDSDCYVKCKDTLKAMLNPQRHQFLCGFPYQLALAEGLIDRELIEDDMSEQDFSEIKFSMEMEALFFGSAEGAFFDFDTIAKSRKIQYPMLPDRIAAKLGNASQIRVPPKAPGEKRILSADIALMSSKKHKNDATSIFLNQLVPSRSGRYISNIVYADSYEGMRTDDQALIIRRFFSDFNCDILVLDAQGIGLGVYDALARDIVDPETREVYPALSCMNDKAMADRCTVPGAEKVIWSIKGYPKFNTSCAFLLREGFQNGRIRLLANEYDAEELMLQEFSRYKSLAPAERIAIKLPYIHTTLLIDELVNLQHEENGDNVRVYEKTGARKDRYSSLAYNYYVASHFENKLTKQSVRENVASGCFAIRAPNTKTEEVRARGGRNKSWRR